MEQVPSRLRGKQLYSLDLGQLVVRGPDENFPGGAGVDAVIWVFPKIGVPQNGWFTIENHIEMDDLGVPLLLETSIWLGKT